MKKKRRVDLTDTELNKFTREVKLGSAGNTDNADFDAMVEATQAELVRARDATAAQRIPEIRRHQPWMTNETFRLIEERRCAKCTGNGGKYGRLNRMVQQGWRKDSDAHMSRICEVIQEYANKNETGALYV